MPSACILCGQVKGKHETKDVHYYRFPADRSKREEWLKAIGLKEEDIKDHSWLCSHHFLNGDSKHVPLLALGRRFASPKKIKRKQSTRRSVSISPSPSSGPSKQLALSKSSSPACTPPCSSGDVSDISDVDSLKASIGEQLFTEYKVHDLPGTSYSEKEVINRALLSCIEYLESKNQKLKETVGCQKTKYFRLEDVVHDDSLIRFYTGFPSYEVLLAVFDFLGPSVNELHYWGTPTTVRTRKRKPKLDTKNQFFFDTYTTQYTSKESCCQVWFVDWISI